MAKRTGKPEGTCILIYSIYAPVAKNILRFGNKYHCKTVAFVPDLPEQMYATKRGLQGIGARYYYHLVKKLQSKFDGYIYLTEEMKNRISSEKPYIVVEGLADESLFVAPTKSSDSENMPIIMYAGTLSKRYGIAELVEAFRQTNLDAQLHIYGYGDFVPELENTFNRMLAFIIKAELAERLFWKKREKPHCW